MSVYSVLILAGIGFVFYWFIAKPLWEAITCPLRGDGNNPYQHAAYMADHLDKSKLAHLRKNVKRNIAKQKYVVDTAYGSATEQTEALIAAATQFVKEGSQDVQVFETVCGMGVSDSQIADAIKFVGAEQSINQNKSEHGGAYVYGAEKPLVEKAVEWKQNDWVVRK